MSQAHNYAFFTRVPLTGAAITMDGNNLDGMRIVGNISVDPKFRKKLEDEDEEGNLVAELHFDKETTISFTLGITENFVFPEPNTVVVLDSDDEFNAVFNGNWLLEEYPSDFKPGERAEVKVKLRKNENMPLTP